MIRIRERNIENIKLLIMCFLLGRINETSLAPSVRCDDKLFDSELLIVFIQIAIRIEQLI